MLLRSVFSNRYPNSLDDPFVSLQRILKYSQDDQVSCLSARVPSKAMSVRMDVKEDEKAFHVTADLPGLTEKEVEVSFDDGLLTIRGEKKIERDEKQDTWHIVERTSGGFIRNLSLSAPIDGTKIEARFEKGVLSITLPKQPQEQNSVHKIEIKSL